MSNINYVQVLQSAFDAPVTMERGVGCGRIYVVVDKEHAKGISTAAKKLGKIFQRTAHYGMKNALYVGYDNCDGRALSRGTKIVETLRAAGIGCHRDEHGD
jgi:hypothetical protein